MTGHLHKHARERLAFAPGTPVPKRLAACKTFLRLENAMIRMKHDAGADGRTVAHDLAAMVDVMLVHLFDYAVKTYELRHESLPSPVVLLALGGYGRSELSPLSDIDIMFLFPSKVSQATIEPLQQHLVDEVLYILWDCGLKVGYSTRTVDDVFTEVRKDIPTKTSLLEARHISGDINLYEAFDKAYRNFYTNDKPKAYITARLEDQVTRRNKYGGTVFLQEPNIKSGVGGLRDYQNTLWMARVKLGIERIDELLEQHYLRRNELRDFKRAYDLLLRVRNELHFQSKRPTDLLDLEAQPRIAYGLGYTHHDPLGRVEQFMRDYYRAAQTIFRVSRLVENRLALSLEDDDRGAMSFSESVRAHRYQKTRRLDGFVVRGRDLSMEHNRIFKDDPVRLVRVFRHCQSLDALPDFALQNLIRESLPLITKHITFSPAANTSFKAILGEAGSVYNTLALMHELGVLGRFIPEFDKLTCLVQHEFYHRYTADIHTLNAIRQLDEVFAKTEPLALKYRSTLHETPSATLLYLILLLHDIGKARGIKGHADFGVEIARPILERLEIDPKSQETVIFIIKNHLIMARFWQKRDVDDPASVAAFAELVPDADHLRYLYVHTFCDARGTAADLWNSYKDTLHTTLYRGTLELLLHGVSLKERNTQRLKAAQHKLVSASIPHISQDEINAHFELLPRRYFIQNEASEIALHISMVHRLLKSINSAETIDTLKPVIEWNDDLNRSLTVVNVITWDRAGLFYKLAGAFSVAGLSILSAKVISRSDNIAIDTFYVVESGRGVVQSTSAQETFAQNVEEALVKNKDLYPAILEQARRHQAPRYGIPAKPLDALQASFPLTVEVYHDDNMARTIVEVQARDAIGLLFRLTRAISEHGFGISFARIGTERTIAIDSFYIENLQPEIPADTDRLQRLRDALIEIITPVELPAAE